VPFVVNAVKPTRSSTSKVLNRCSQKRDYHFDVATRSKHAALGELIMQDKIAIGGEQSAALSIRHHAPEKDALLAGLLCCEMVAPRHKSLGEAIARTM
jgi:phosphomannomutase